jgi:hypothetical protein
MLRKWTERITGDSDKHPSGWLFCTIQQSLLQCSEHSECPDCLDMVQLEWECLFPSSGTWHPAQPLSRQVVQTPQGTPGFQRQGSSPFQTFSTHTDYLVINLCGAHWQDYCVGPAPQEGGAVARHRSPAGTYRCGRPAVLWVWHTGLWGVRGQGAAFLFACGHWPCEFHFSPTQPLPYPTPWMSQLHPTGYSGSVGKCLPSIHKALGLYPQHQEKKRGKKKSGQTLLCGGGNLHWMKGDAEGPALQGKWEVKQFAGERQPPRAAWNSRGCSPYTLCFADDLLLYWLMLSRVLILTPWLIISCFHHWAISSASSETLTQTALERVGLVSHLRPQPLKKWVLTANRKSSPKRFFKYHWVSIFPNYIFKR